MKPKVDPSTGKAYAGRVRHHPPQVESKKEEEFSEIELATATAIAHLILGKPVEISSLKIITEVPPSVADDLEGNKRSKRNRKKNENSSTK